MAVRSAENADKSQQGASRAWFWDGAAGAIALAALAVGLILAYQHRGQTSADLIYDAKVYDELAKSLLSEHRYNTTYWPPGFAVFLAGVYAVFGAKVWAVYAVQAALFATSVLLVYQAARMITGHRGIALVSCAAWAAWPVGYIMVCRLLPSALSAFLMSMSAYLMVICFNNPSARSCFWAGLALGVNAVTVAATLPFGLASAVLVRWSGRGSRPAWMLAVWLLLGLACLTLPWTLYASYKAGAPVIGSTGGGFNFYLGNCPPWDREPWRGDFPEPIARKIDGRSEAQRDRILLREGLRCIAENPLRAVVRLGQKFSHLWLGELGLAEAVRTPPGPFDPVRRPIVRVPLFLLAVLGIFVAPVEWRRRAAPVILLLVAVTGVYIVVTAEARYSFPMIPYALFFAVIALNRLGQALARAVKPE